ncbi:MAG: FG-GAP repeat domain-containing protein, partial [Verrucomicrobiales bacterium]
MPSARKFAVTATAPSILACLFLLPACNEADQGAEAGPASPDTEPPAASGAAAASSSSESVPLAQASDRSGSGKLFTSLPPSETGIDFNNRIDPDHPLRYLYATEKVCGGVAVGDLNGDGRPDIYFTSGPAKNRLYLQGEGLKFIDHTAAAGVDGSGAWSAGAAMVDIDADGDLDIYVANYSAPNQLYINRGDASFDERAKDFGLDHISASHMPAFCDYDRDGDLDLYL